MTLYVLAALVALAALIALVAIIMRRQPHGETRIKSDFMTQSVLTRIRNQYPSDTR